MSDEHNPHIVKVVHPPADALSSPTFIIKVEDRYYVTLALWEYRLKDATTDAQRESVEEIMRVYRAAPPADARMAPSGPVHVPGSHTGPIH